MISQIRFRDVKKYFGDIHVSNYIFISQNRVCYVVNSIFISQIESVHGVTNHNNFKITKLNFDISSISVLK